MPGTSSIWFGSASWRSATPCRILIASASAVGVRSAMAMSLVIWPPAIGTTAVCRMAPWVKTARSVVPPPMSSRHTPRSFSSSESTAREEASGCNTRSFTSMPQRRTHLMMFCAADTPPVTLGNFTSRGQPDIPMALAPGAHNHIDLSPQTPCGHADRPEHVFLEVDDELLAQHMQDLLIGRDID